MSIPIIYLLDTGRNMRHKRTIVNYGARRMIQWCNDMSTAPTDGTVILGWCDHNADPYNDPGVPYRLTTYGAHAEGLSHCEDGPQLITWGGEFDDADDGYIPNW